MTEYCLTPPKVTVGLLREIVTGYCDTCPHSKNTESCCQSGCLGLRILSDIDAFVAERRVDKMHEFDSSVGSLTLPSDLAGRSIRWCVRHGDN